MISYCLCSKCDFKMLLIKVYLFLLTLVIISVNIFCRDTWLRQRSLNYKYKTYDYKKSYRGRLAGYPSMPLSKWRFQTQVSPQKFINSPLINSIEGPLAAPVNSKLKFEIPNSISEVVTSVPDVHKVQSSNDLIGGSFWREDFVIDPNICHKMGGLTREQLQLCYRLPDVVSVASVGLRIAVKECQQQLKGHRWNCSSLSFHEENPHAAPIMSRGYRETAFVHAITSAGVTHSVARACAAGKLTSCSCGIVNGKRAWKWSGCHDNTKYGAKFSRMFLDIREQARDLLSYTHLFNNEVGRKVIRRTRDIHCKCHGLSGSCEIRTCWKAVPKFKSVGKILVRKMQDMKSASHAVFGNAAHRLQSFKSLRKSINMNSPLLFAEQSPNYCQANSKLGVEGTVGRVCNRTSRGAESCGVLCCGRGYDIVKQRTTKKCHCRFKWCCQVTCRDCVSEEWIAICK